MQSLRAVYGDANNAVGLDPHAKQGLSHAKPQCVQPGKDRKDKVKLSFNSNQIILFHSGKILFGISHSCSRCARWFGRICSDYLRGCLCVLNVSSCGHDGWACAAQTAASCRDFQIVRLLCVFVSVCTHVKVQKTDRYHHVLPVRLRCTRVRVCACVFVADRVSSHSGNFSEAQTGAEFGHAGTGFVLNWDIFGLLCYYGTGC